MNGFGGAVTWTSNLLVLGTFICNSTLAVWIVIAH